MTEQLTWSGWGAAGPGAPHWVLEARFPVGERDRGYWHSVTRTIWPQELERYGDRLVCSVLHEMVLEVRDLAYEALCDNVLMFDVHTAWRRARDATQRAREAEDRADRIENKARRLRAILEQLSDGDDSEDEPL